MPSLLTLPLELRQKIFGYAFEDATKADVRLNLWMRVNFRTCIDCMPLELIRLIDSGPHKLTEGQPIDSKRLAFHARIFFLSHMNTFEHLEAIGVICLCSRHPLNTRYLFSARHKTTSSSK